MTETSERGSARLIAGRYRLDHPIGQGGMGEVWAGYDVRLDRRVAVKLLKQPSPAAAARSSAQEQVENARQRFLREVRTTAGLVHSGIPAVHDAGMDGDDLFLVMELLAGSELAGVIAEHAEGPGALPVSWAAAVGAQVASVLAEVHGLSVVHRDIKPGNLYLTPGGTVKVLDFGVAALLGADLPRLTAIGHTVGTPPYMAPEQAVASPVASDVGPAADLYSLGCVLHEMLTGDPPFMPGDVRQLIWHHLNTDPPPLRELREDVPEAVEALVLALLAKDPEARPSTDDVYEKLLPHARAGGGGAGAGYRELNPTRPFTRPMAAVPHRRRPAPRQPALSHEEADEVLDRAASLADEMLWVQAVDVLEQAIARAGGDPELEYDLRFRLAQVLFVAAAYRRALVQFEAVEVRYTEWYGPKYLDVLECRYYAATCRAALGENTAALRAFRVFLPEWIHATSPADERALDVRRQISLLLASAGRYDEARATLSDLLADATKLQGATSDLAQLLTALLDRLNRYSR